MTGEVLRSLCDERTARIEQRIDGLSVAVGETHAAVYEIRKLLLGNGDVGIFERMRDIDDWRVRHETAHKAAVKIAQAVITNPNTWKLVAAIGAALGVGGGVLALWR